MLVDSHCHVDMYRNPAVAAREVERSGIVTVAVTNLPSHYRAGREHVAEYHHVRFALGLHPLLARHHRDELDLFDAEADGTDYIGEVGLDFSREGFKTRDLQLASFERVLDRIGDRPRFVTLHSRGAEAEVLTALDRHRIDQAVFHWFSGSAALLRKAADRGHFFSVNPAMIASERGMSLVRRMPTDRLLTESDGPHVRIQERAANPKDVRMVLEVLAHEWGVPVSDAEDFVATNFLRLTSLLNRSKA